MHFMPDLTTPCSKCSGQRYRQEVLQIKYKGFSIANLLDESTTGLHDDDVKKLCDILNELTIKGATVIVIEHHPLLIGQADYLIEMGPEGGDRGGYVTRAGWLRKQGE